MIDENGAILKKRRDMDQSEKKSLTLFDVMIFNIKKQLAKLPGGDSKIRNFATALWLLKEDIDLGFVDQNDVFVLAEEVSAEKEFSELTEEIANSIGGGAMDNTVVAVKPKDQPKTSQFGKCRVYHVSEQAFCSHRRTKGRYERFMKHIGPGPVHDDIREYAKKHPTESILIHNETMGAYAVLKLGSKGAW